MTVEEKMNKDVRIVQVALDLYALFLGAERITRRDRRFRSNVDAMLLIPEFAPSYAFDPDDDRSPMAQLEYIVYDSISMVGRKYQVVLSDYHAASPASFNADVIFDGTLHDFVRQFRACASDALVKDCVDELVKNEYIAESARSKFLKRYRYVLDAEADALEKVADVLEQEDKEAKVKAR